MEIDRGDEVKIQNEQTFGEVVAVDRINLTIDIKKGPKRAKLHPTAVFAFAALWERLGDAHGTPGAAILTCPPNEMVAAIHDRMPVMLTGEASARWLESGELDLARFAELLRPFPADQMEVYPVSPLVNSAEHDFPELVLPSGELG